MASAKVPLRILMQTCLPEGQRLPKRVQVLPAKPTRTLWQNQQSEQRPFKPFGMHSAATELAMRAHNLRNRESGTVLTLGGNIPFMEFRFWIGTRQQASRFAVCRGCKKICHYPHERKGHMDRWKCTDLLVNAYKLLLEDKNCVICDTRTHEEKWGVPLCSPNCQDVWMFTVRRSPAMEAAIEMVYKAGWKTPPEPTVVVATEADMHKAIDDAVGMEEAWGIQREY